MMPVIIANMHALIALLAFFVAASSAHSWIEQLMVVGSNGTFIGEPGYPRGNVQRTTPGFSDPLMTNLIPPNTQPNNTVLSTTRICSASQQTYNQTAGNPRLQAPAGAAIALRYQENGHVTLPQNQAGKPPNRGTVYVYGTTDPRENDTLLAIHKVWNGNGTGGDGRGVLLSTQNFDDGRCYQINSGNISTIRQKTFSHQANQLMGADLWCQQDIALPSDAPTGKPYTLYWVWDWPTLPSADRKALNELYTTCMDINVTDNKTMLKYPAGSGYIEDQPLDNAAIPSQFADLENSHSASPAVMSGSSSSTPSSVSVTTPAASMTAQPSQNPTSSFQIPSTLVTSVLPSTSALWAKIGTPGIDFNGEG
jgi:hypothetical protein